MKNRLLYIIYYFKNLDWEKFNRFFAYVEKNYSFSKVVLWKDIIVSSFTYNVSLLDYFYFRFFEMEKNERKTYAGTGYMYEYQLKMNPVNSRGILENKIQFHEQYEEFIGHKFWKKDDVLSDDILFNEIIKNNEKLILKSSDGQCGEGIQLIDVTNLDNEKLKDVLNVSKNDMLEQYIVQHDKLMELSPAGLNTVRIFSQLNHKDEVVFLGARIRITVDSYVDNLAAGNIAAPIDINSGIVKGPGVYSDIENSEVSTHPRTGIKIVGFQVPYWDETIAMVKEAALRHPQNRSIGWDVAITNSGPALLEGNHNWCKLLWQLPVKKGLKSELEKFLQ